MTNDELSGVPGGPAAPPARPSPPPASGTALSAGRIVAIVVGCMLLLVAAGTAVGGTAVLAADRSGRDSDGFLAVAGQGVTGSGHALVFDPVELQSDPGMPDLGKALGAVRIRATGEAPGGVFVGIGPADAVGGYLADVRRDRLVDLAAGRPVVPLPLPGGAPATPPAAQPFWVASATGPGPQQVTWTATDGRWVVVVMNADGSRPVVADLSLGTAAPWLRWVWIGLYAGAGLALVGGAVLVLLVVRRRTGKPA